MKREINASVHDIVDFVYAQGDILPAFSQKTSLTDGTLLHSYIQKQFDCEREFYVKYNGQIKDYTIFLQGKIDLLDKNEDPFHIIEIKSTHSFEHLDENSHLAHFAQAKFYGIMLYETLGLDHSKELKISVMYVNKYNYAKKYFTKDYSYHELYAFFNETMEKFIYFRSMIDDFAEIKLASIHDLDFPYAQKRKGQNELIETVEQAIENKQNLFVCAPTGIGKSLGTIYPAIKSLDHKDQKIFYLTSKSMIKDIARNALELMRINNLKIKSLSITAKEKVCINDCVKCNPHDCIYAKDFYGRVNEAMMDIYQHEDDLHYDNILYYSRKYQICPFEFQLSLSLMVDVIICDYNYVFDLRVYLRRFFDFDTSHITLLIDEAHNMYDRVCGMYTHRLNFDMIHGILDHVHEEEISRACQHVFHKLTQYQNLLFQNRKKNMKFVDCDPVLLDSINSLINKLDKYFDKCREQDQEIPEKLLEHYFEISNFLKVSDYFNEDFIIWVYEEQEDTNYQITCLNPRYLIKMRTDALRASVFFSATLHPVDYYTSLYGGDSNSLKLVLNSPFNQHHLKLLINSHISTKYKDREMTKYQVAYQIEELVQLGGKYLVYFPSYQYLDLVYQIFMKVNQVPIEVIKQERMMSEKERNQFIDQFDESDRNIVGFAVLGGVFAEGIDLKGEKLNGVIIVGVGLPTFDDFRGELRSYFDQVYSKGYQYAYMYPGFNKVLQAVGRVIRDDDDKGVAILIDDRYLSYEYLKLYPSHWSHFEKV